MKIFRTVRKYKFMKSGKIEPIPIDPDNCITYESEERKGWNMARGKTMKLFKITCLEEAEEGLFKKKEFMSVHEEEDLAVEALKSKGNLDFVKVERVEDPEVFNL